ncbi:hypothetical protein GS456_17760 [Rhodococcus hoagii]|nr:hypothetical protein [Prescottella equi]
MERLAAQDPDADAAVGAQANTADQFLDWATGHFKVKAQVAWPDLMSERDTLTDAMFVVCRTILADPKRWSEFGPPSSGGLLGGAPTTTDPTSDDDGVTDAIVEARASEDRAVRPGLSGHSPGVLADVVPRVRRPRNAPSRSKPSRTPSTSVPARSSTTVGTWPRRVRRNHADGYTDTGDRSGPGAALGKLA